METAKPSRSKTMGDLADSEILDRINVVSVNVARLETKVDALLSGQTRCNDHAQRLRCVEETIAADKRVRAFIYAAICLGVPAVTSVIVVLINRFA